MPEPRREAEAVLSKLERPSLFERRCPRSLLVEIDAARKAGPVTVRRIESKAASR